LLEKKLGAAGAAGAAVGAAAGAAVGGVSGVTGVPQFRQNLLSLSTCAPHFSQNIVITSSFLYFSGHGNYISSG